MIEYEKGSEVRKADYPIDDVFLDRWSPRAMSGEKITDEELLVLFEAARWAPSNSNEQPWRFIYAHRDTPNWENFFSALEEFNQMWCKNAAALLCLIAKKNFTKNNGANRNCMSDAGAAWENFALQGSLLGYVVHGMAGYDVGKIRENLEVPNDYEIVHMIAVGKPGDISVLHERMQKSEKPNGRVKVKDFVFEGKFREESEDDGTLEESEAESESEE